VKVDSSVTIGYDADTETFSGEIDSTAARIRYRTAYSVAERRCRKHRLVQLKQVKKGPDPKVDGDRTNVAGAWEMQPFLGADIRYREQSFLGADRKFYADAPRIIKYTMDGTKIVCKHDRSRTITVKASGP
jgi:hypothetical protein